MRVSSLCEDWHHATGSGSLLRSMLDNSCDSRHPAYTFRIGGLPNDFRANWAFLPHPTITQSTHGRIQRPS